MSCTFNLVSAPAGVSFLPGSKLLLVRRQSNGVGLYLEEELVWEAVERLRGHHTEKTSDRADIQDSDTQR